MSTTAKPKAAIYARVSLGAKHGQRIENQTESLADYARARGFEVVEIYTDVASGTKDRRPALDRLMSDASRRRFDLLLVTALDRCFRSTKHMLQMVENLEHVGVRLISLRENLDLSSPAGRMAMTVLAAVAALEVEILKERIRQGIYQRRAAAEKAGIPWRNGRPPIEQTVIDEVLRLRQQGLSIRGIEKALNKQISKSAIARLIADNAVPASSSETPVPDAVHKGETTGGGESDEN